LTERARRVIRTAAAASRTHRIACERAKARKAAAKAARNLIAQGIEGVTIMNEDGRVYVPDEFNAFLDEDN
jgi:hypothetical protein